MEDLLIKKQARLKAIEKTIGRLDKTPLALVEEIIRLEEEIAVLKSKQPSILDNVSRWLEEVL